MSAHLDHGDSRCLGRLGCVEWRPRSPRMHQPCHLLVSWGPTQHRLKLTKFHVYAGNLDPRLHELWPDVQRLLQIRLGADRVPDQESTSQPKPILKFPCNSLESTPHVVRLGLTLLPRNTLLDRLVDEGHGVSVISSVESVECEDKCLVSLRWALWQGRLVV